MNTDSSIASIFLTKSSDSLTRMSGLIERCVERLSDEQIWSRGSENENSVGNLILHISGNARQWICSGIGAQEDTRNRDLEFSTKGGRSKTHLLETMRTTLEEANHVMREVTPKRLTEAITVQNSTQSVLETIYHVVGHFQQHTGQIIFATKILTGEDLGLQRPNPAPRNPAGH